MKAIYKASEKLQLECDVKDCTQAFQFAAKCTTLFGICRCGNCESVNLSPVYKTPQGYEYYSVRCEDCKHELKFGITKEGHNLFPKEWEPPYERDGDGDDGGYNQDNDNRGRSRSRDDNGDYDDSRRSRGGNNSRDDDRGRPAPSDDIPF